MADIKSQESRSYNMSRIRNCETKPEIFIRKLLFQKGYRYRKNVSNIPGHPDIYLKKYNTAIFVHGCFWHRHSGCKYAYIPKSREEFWEKKFKQNIKRDNQVLQELADRRIRRLIVWECTIKRMQKNDDYKNEILEIIEEFICGNIEYCEI